MLTDKERYLFDLQGYLEIDDVLKPDEVADLNHKIGSSVEFVGELWLG